MAYSDDSSVFEAFLVAAFASSCNETSTYRLPLRLEIRIFIPASSGLMM
jgi:hypothetical protein